MPKKPKPPTYVKKAQGLKKQKSLGYKIPNGHATSLKSLRKMLR